jgi:hypothetical protein
MEKLAISPDQSASGSYDWTPASGVLVAPLDGGAPRSRTDILGGWGTINVQWTTNPKGYEYLALAARYCDENGGYHFLIDLITSLSIIRETVAMFVPGTFKLSSYNGLTYICTAQLYVEPLDDAPAVWPTVTDFQQGIITTEGGEPITT